MSRRIIIAFDLPADSSEKNSLIHRIRNFGEDLFREFVRSGEAKLDIAQVDHATDRLSVTAIKKRNLRTVSAVIIKALKRDHLDDCAHLAEESVEP